MFVAVRWSWNVRSLMIRPRCPWRECWRGRWVRRRRPSVAQRCARDRPARSLVARLAALRVGRGLRVARAGSEASRGQAGEAAGAQASVCLRGAGAGRSIRRVGGLTRTRHVIERELHLLMPSHDEGPQRSPQLLRGAQERRAGSPELLDPWMVPAIGLGPVAALELLLALPAGGYAVTPNPQGVALGDSLRFLAEAGKLALELVARGRLLPGLVRRDEGWVAWWRAMPGDPEDAERVRMLVAAMPPLVRAEISCSGGEQRARGGRGRSAGDGRRRVRASFLVDGLAGGRAGRRSKREPRSSMHGWRR